MPSASCWTALLCECPRSPPFPSPLASPPFSFECPRVPSRHEVFLTIARRRNSDPRDRPTAERLLTQHAFCELDPDYNFFDTALYAKIRETFQ